jgi:hypothetical protein
MSALPGVTQNIKWFCYRQSIVHLDAEISKWVSGRHGVIEILDPEMSNEERLALERSAGRLKQALDRIG